MLATLCVAGAAVLVALAGLAGRHRLGATSPAMALTLTLPLCALLAAPFVGKGLTVLWVVCAAAAIAIGVVVAVLLPPIATDFAWLLSCLIQLVIAGLFLSWLADVITSLSYLNYYATVLVLVVGAGAAAYGGMARRALTRVVAVVTAAAAVLLLAGGVLAGSAASLGDPVIQTSAIGLGPGICFLVMLAIVTAASCGLRQSAAANRRATLVGGGLLCLAVLAAAIGLLMLVGGAIVSPSVPLETLSAYTPPAVAGIICGVLAAVGAATVALAMSQCEPWLTGFIRRDAERPLIRAAACVLMMAVVGAIALTQASPEWLVPVAALLGLVSVVPASRSKVVTDEAERIPSRLP